MSLTQSWIRRTGASLGTAALLISICCVLPGCRRTHRDVSIDLLQTPPGSFRPTREIRPRDESTRQLLLDGFRVTSDGKFFVSSADNFGRFGFYVTRPVAGVLRVPGRADPPMTVRLRLNGRDHGDAVYRAESSDVRFQIPQSILAEGLNTASLRLAVDPKNAPPGGLTLDRISIENPLPGVACVLGGPAPAVRLEANSEVHWCAHASGDRLEFTFEASSPGPTPSEIDLLVETDTQPLTSLWRSSVTAREEHEIEGKVDYQTFSGSFARIHVRLRSGDPTARVTIRRLQVTRPGTNAATAEPRAPAAAQRPNVIIFLVDALRRDHLSLYGYGRPTSPELDRFAREAVVFDNAYTQASWTSPTVGALFTGEYPLTTGIRTHSDGLHLRFTTIAELLKTKGYRTIACVANAGVGTKLGFSQGFDDFVHSSKDVTTLVQTALDRLPPSGHPFFLYIHTMDVHYPYDRAPAPFDGLVQAPPGTTLTEDAISIKKLKNGTLVPTAADLEFILSLYDSEIRETDDQFGRFLRALSSLGHESNSLIFFLADHGEEFNDHGGYYHGQSLHNEQLRIPLVVKPPFRTTVRRIDAPVQTIDIYPTIANLVGLQVSVAGRNLLPALDGSSHLDLNAPIYSETDLAISYRSLIIGNHKLILRNRQREGRADDFALYDLQQDPLERDNRLSRQLPITAECMGALIRRHENEATKRRGFREEEIRQTLDEETRKELEALGYLASGEK